MSRFDDKKTGAKRFKFGARSTRNLVTVKPELQRVCRRALDWGIMDFSVIQGLRTQAQQDRLYAQGRTEPGPIVTWTRNSPHLTGDAVDVAPYPINWDNTKEFYKLAGVMKAAAIVEGVDLVWGGSWVKYKDLPHYELRNRDE